MRERNGILETCGSTNVVRSANVFAKIMLNLKAKPLDISDWAEFLNRIK
jgi:hypothetical protein